MQETADDEAADDPGTAEIKSPYIKQCLDGWKDTLPTGDAAPMTLQLKARKAAMAAVMPAVAAIPEVPVDILTYNRQRIAAAAQTAHATPSHAPMQPTASGKAGTPATAAG
ncbi:hypothetical protein WJX72_003544 [[Myrmecia] bisecta]|uniref:Uncharacterized protein n=1 Tax=[Myrmecia] bisecta TaxID=41462 RepID=A0AAW1QEQ3_9CHLO